LIQPSGVSGFLKVWKTGASIQTERNQSHEDTQFFLPEKRPTDFSRLRLP
jgi:hypothetical protein